MDIMCFAIAIVIAIYICCTDKMKKDNTNYIEIKIPKIKKKGKKNICKK